MRFVFLLSLSALAYGQSRPVELTYDKATNQTLFTATSPIHLPASAEDRLALCGLPRFDIQHAFEVTYRCSGDVSGCSNGSLVLKFSFCTSRWTFNTVQVGMTIDGKPVALQPSMHPGRVITGSVLEDSVSVEVPVSATRGLSTESKIDVNLGAISYQLSGGNVGTLRSIAERIR